MRLTYRQIEYIREVARHNSVTDACKKLHISQSSVLAAIDVAEEVTGTRLFNRRKGYGIELTPAGHKFMLSVHRFLAAGNDFNRSLDEFSESSTNSMRIGCYSPFGGILLPPVLKRYMQTHGNCEVTLMEGDQVQLRNWLTTGVVDFVVTYDIGVHDNSSITPICGLYAHALLRKDNPLAKQSSVSISELAEYPLILLDLPETRTYLIALFTFAGVQPDIGLRTRSYETIRSAVVSGLGVSVLNLRPSDSDTNPDNKKLIRIPIADKIRKPILVVSDLYGDQKPGYVKAFIHILHDYFSNLGPEKFSVALPEYAKDLLFPRPDL